jgi:hypothetical protein
MEKICCPAVACRRASTLSATKVDLFFIMSLTGMSLTIPGILIEPISSHSAALLRLVTACRVKKSVIDVLRSRTGNLINLGSGGNRPIFMFSGLRECSARLKPVIFLQQRYRDSAE